MPLNRRIVVFVLIVSALAWPIAAAADPSDYFYVAAEDLPPRLLPAPPAENSVAFQKEIVAVIAAQRNLDEKEKALLRDEQHLRLELITSILGPSINRVRLPKTFALLDHVLSDASAITEADKKFWLTRRPYLADRRVRLFVDPIDQSPAYPSGHTSEMRVIAEVLGLLYPYHLPALRARAEQIARHRVEAGVHYPADIAGGRLLAMLIVGALMESEEFQIDLLAARQEIGENP